MPNNDGSLKYATEQIKRWGDWSMAMIGLGIAAFLNFYFDRDDFDATINRLNELTVSIADCLYLLILFSLFIYLALWHFNRHLEVDQIVEWLNPPNYMPKHPYFFYFNLLFIGLFIGFLFVSAINIRMLMLVFVGYCILDLTMWWVRLNEIKHTVEDSRAELIRRKNILIRSATPENQVEMNDIHIHLQAVNLFDEYYLKKPHYTRVFLQMTPTATLLAVPWFFSRFDIRYEDNITSWVNNVSFQYAVIWISVFLAEIVIWRWRSELRFGLAFLRKARRHKIV